MNSTRVLQIIIIILAGILCISLMFAGYLLFFNRNPVPQDTSQVNTQIVETMNAQFTQAAIDTMVVQWTQLALGTPLPTNTPTSPPLALTPTPTNTFTVIQATPTFTPLPTPIPPIPTATRVPNCNMAQFVADLTIEDGSAYPTNFSFTKIWRIKNVSECVWDSSYSLVFDGGTNMASTNAVSFPNSVPPGGTVDLAVNMKTPDKKGSFTSNWIFRNPNGKLFGVGSSYSNPIFASLQVIIPLSGTSFDFSAETCKAQWNSGVDKVNCTATSSSPDGSAIVITDPNLENRPEDERAIWSRPNQSSNGYISGKFSGYTIKANDHFVADVGCLRGFKNCNVTFKLDFINPNGNLKNLGTWNEVNDGKITRIDIDLTSDAGKNVQFVLSLYNNGKVADAQAVWFVPAIRQATPATPTPTTQPPTPTPTPTPPSSPPTFTWNQTGGIAGVCDQLNIYYTASGAEGQTFNCLSNPPVLLGKGPLTADELATLNSWVSTFLPIESHYISDKSDGFSYIIRLAGRGSQQATTAVIITMQDWGSMVYDRLTP